MQEPKFNFLEPVPEMIAVLKALRDKLDDKGEKSKEGLLELLGIYNALYKPPPALKEKIDTYNLLYSKDTDSANIRKGATDVGRMMEQIACLAFKGLSEASTFKSIQTPESQIDLVVTLHPESLTRSILRINGDKIIIEAKNRNSAVNVKDFSRIVALLDYKYHEQCSLGVFFSRKGATGFPRIRKRQRVLKDALAIQVIFHARSSKYIVVFDHDDIQMLLEPGSLLKLLKAKMGEIEDTPGIRLKFDENFNEEDDLPDYLSSVI